jgi:hypothetical protein
MKTKHGPALLRLVGVVCLMVCPAFSATYIPGADFSIAANPNGVWSYGYELVLGGSFTLFTDSGSDGSIDNWHYSAFDFGVGHNTTAAPAGWCGSCSIPAGYAAFGPGNNGAFAVFRFTAPDTDDYTIDLSFLGADFSGPTTSDVNVLHNGSSLFSSFINGFGPSSTAAYSGVESLLAGDTIDIAVGWGSNNNYAYDSTAFDGTIANVVATPEPATSALIGGAGLLLAAFARWRRR